MINHSHSAEEIWDRPRRFLAEMLPVAGKAGVKLAIHPDDPPLPVLRGAARLIYHPDHFQIPDPPLDCAAPWHASSPFTLQGPPKFGA